MSLNTPPNQLRGADQAPDQPAPSPSATGPQGMAQPPPSRRKVFGTSRRAPGFLERWRERYGPGQPDPWIQLKAMVFVLFALAVWSFYVVVGRACTSIIRGTSSTGMTKATGIGILVGWVILWLMFIWTYIRIISTSPGFAPQKVPNCPRPELDHREPSREYIPYRPPPPSQQQPSNGPLPLPDFLSQYSGRPGELHGRMTDDPDGPDLSDWGLLANTVQNALRQEPPVPTSTELLSPTLLSHPTAPDSSTTLAPDYPPSQAVKRKSDVPNWQEIERPVPQVSIGPRWCPHCEIMKPDRTHHCRHCGTCVMQFDHHCMWIGTCVGWANHKFFILFNAWTAIFTGYTLGFLAAYTAKSQDVDGQVIAIMVICAFFFLFTPAMLGTHIHLIMTGRSTLESFAHRDQVERENAILQHHFGTFLHNMEKRKVRKKWKEEYGNVGVDERWRWGSRRILWEEEMGRSWLGWIFPVGKPLGDGLHYNRNPRFGANGEWLKKKDWPEDLLDVQ